MVLEEAEDVVLWFSTLSDVKRISVMYGLLNKCLPFELRFLGACIEDCFKPYYQSFRELEYKANNPSELNKLTDLKDDKIRSRLITSIALLFSSNRACSKIIFNTLTNPTNLELLSQQRTFYDELLLLFTLALKHPAFTFAQKQDLEWHLKETSRVQSPELVIESNEETKSTLQAGDPLDPNGDGQPHCDAGIPVANGILSQCPTCGALSGPFGVAPYFYPTATSSVPFNWTCPPPSTLPPPPPILPSPTSIVPPETSHVNRSPCSTRSIGLPVYASRAHVKHLELKNGPRQRKGDKRKDYRIQVTWSNGEVTEVSKTAQDLCDFHQQQKKAVPTPTPYFAGPPKQLLRNDDSEDLTGRINEYLRQLMGKVPLDSDSVTNFFRPSSESPSSQSNNTGGVTSNSDDQNVCSSPTRSNTASPSPTAHSKYSRTSPVNALHYASGVNEVTQQLNSMTIYNSCHTSDSGPNKTIVSSGVPQPVVRTATSTEHPVSVSYSKQPRHANTQVLPDCNEERGLEFEKLLKTWEIHQKKHLPVNKVVSLMDEQLKNDGFSTVQRRKILDKLQAHKQPLLNGFCAQPDIDTTHRSSPSSVQSNCCTVQMVVMPDAPIDLLTSLCMDPLKTSHSKINRPTLHNPPDSPGSAHHAWHASSPVRSVSNGEVDDTFGEDGNYDYSSPRLCSQPNCRPANLNVKDNELSRELRLRRNSRGGGNGGSHSKMKRSTGRPGDTSARKTSLTSPMEVKLAYLPGCDDGSATVKSPCSVAEESPCPPTYSYANIPFSTLNGALPLGISEDAQGNNGPAVVGSLPATQNYNAVANGTYSPAASMVQSHSHMQPRLPSRPLNAMGMCTTCPCTRPSTTPPPMPQTHPIYHPPHFILTAFPPNPAAYTTNGFMTTGVPPPHTFHQFMHSPEGMPAAHEVAFPHYVQQPQPPGVSGSQRMQHPPPVPGFVAGPTPNVGFHGNPMQPPGSNAGMMPPPLAPHVPLLATVPNPSHKTPTCFNCGLVGHNGVDCSEKTMDDVSKGGQFQLLFNRGDKSLDGCE